MPAIQVLIVDDDADTCEMLGELISMLGHKAIVANNGIEALDRFRATSPQIAFLDLDLPGMSGFELASTIRSLGTPVRLVALSGHTEQAYRDRVRVSGFDAYLRKPCDVAAISAQIDASRAPIPTPVPRVR